MSQTQNHIVSLYICGCALAVVIVVASLFLLVAVLLFAAIVCLLVVLGMFAYSQQVGSLPTL